MTREGTRASGQAKEPAAVLPEVRKRDVQETGARPPKSNLFVAGWHGLQSGRLCSPHELSVRGQETSPPALELPSGAATCAPFLQ